MDYIVTPAKDLYKDFDKGHVPSELERKSLARILF